MVSDDGVLSMFGVCVLGCGVRWLRCDVRWSGCGCAVWKGWSGPRQQEGSVGERRGEGGQWRKGSEKGK